MILRIMVGYGANDIMRKSRDHYEMVRTAFAGIHDMVEWAEGAEAPKYIHFGGTDLVVTETEMAMLARLEIPFEVKNFKHGYWSGGKPEPKEVVAGNTTNVHIAIPNIGLLMIDEVDYEEDCCTDRLQFKLNDGWRILAVCPPNGDRRPTYILGRNKSNG